MSSLQHLAIPTDIEQPEINQHGSAVRLDQVEKHFGQLTVLNQIRLDIQAGKFVAIVGRSGCGKSTLLRLIASLDQPNAGRIEIGSPYKVESYTDIRVMFQEPRLLPWKTVLQNVQLGLPKHQLQHATELLATVGLADKANLWPSQLSGGQKQRVALARALAHQPSLLLLDEPLGALDALTRLEMQQLIENIWKKHGFTAILVTHDVSEAVQLADRIILLDQGNIARSFNVNLPHPRNKSNPLFASLEAEVLQSILAT